MGSDTMAMLTDLKSSMIHIGSFSGSLVEIPGIPSKKDGYKIPYGRMKYGR